MIILSEYKTVNNKIPNAFKWSGNWIWSSVYFTFIKGDYKQFSLIVHVHPQVLKMQNRQTYRLNKQLIISSNNCVYI